MATTRSPIKGPCENEDLPEKENEPDFDGTLYEVSLMFNFSFSYGRNFLYSTGFNNVSRGGEQYVYCMTTLKDIWPVMTLTETQKPLLFSFLKNQRKYTKL